MKSARQKLRKECEKAKRALSSTTSTKLFIENIIQGFDFEEILTRAKFEQLNADLFQRFVYLNQMFRFLANYYNDL